MEESLVTVARFEWRMEAVLARCRLESCGIETFLPDEFATSVYWDYAKALGGIRVQVDSRDAGDARAILEEDPRDAGEPIMTESEERADRVLRAAVFGAVAFPLAYYACWLLLNALLAGGPLGLRERRQVILAAVLNLPFVLLSAWFGAIPALRRLI
jgi:hypothetical protein